MSLQIPETGVQLSVTVIPDKFLVHEVFVSVVEQKMWFKLVVLDTFTQATGKRTRVTLIALSGEEPRFILPFENRLLVKSFDFPVIILYTRFMADQGYLDSAKMTTSRSSIPNSSTLCKMQYGARE
ncbi:hypothetical protein BOTCAL_0068g00300 [Botryotinia calthae]|uniref:Uncharacterized protein n=1 Tax=Botryotinia calthae TaxID=38488 RepID=A0A4Y8D958_9HELO|nr:hypothetical protein BOTCAL_0068g00300 [Botryotinia calthae]